MPRATLKLIDESDRLLQMLRDVNPELKVGKVDVAAFADLTDNLRESHALITDANSKLISYRTQRRVQERLVRKAMTALRNGVEADFGDNSAEYERSGRTPVSKRGRNSATKAANAAGPASSAATDEPNAGA